MEISLHINNDNLEYAKARGNASWTFLVATMSAPTLYLMISGHHFNDI